jgi:uncharacterized protein (TIGR00251 family)
MGLRGDAPSATLRLRVVPGARRDGVLGFHGEALKVAVRAPPERGRANEAVLELIADYVGVPRTHVSLERGAASRDKLVRITGIAPDELGRRLGAGDALVCFAPAPPMRAGKRLRSSLVPAQGAGTNKKRLRLSASSEARSRKGASRAE